LENNDISTIEGKIINAAYNIILRRGIDVTTMGQIADEAGISRTSLNYYFKDKNQLYLKVIDNLENKIIPGISRIVFDENLSLLEKVDMFIDEYIELIKQNPMVPPFILEEVRRNPNLMETFIKRRNLIFEKLSEQIDQEVAQGKINPIQLSDLFVNVMALCAFPVLSKPLLMNFFFNGEEAKLLEFMNLRGEEVKKIIHGWILPK
jgi:AcrR family transcriptional regulator